jgi:hypothetical protein
VVYQLETVCLHDPHYGTTVYSRLRGKLQCHKTNFSMRVWEKNPLLVLYSAMQEGLRVGRIPLDRKNLFRASSLVVLRDAIINQVRRTIGSLLAFLVNSRACHLRLVFEVTLRILLHAVTYFRRESDEWKRVVWAVLVLGLLPIFIFGVAFFFPLNSVNAGVDANRVFLYGTMTLYQILAILPWIETCNFAMPASKLSLRARGLALLSLVVGSKLCDAVVAEGLFGRAIFPVPFSIMVCIMGAVGLVGPLISYFTPRNDTIHFNGVQYLLLAYCASFLVVTGWAVGIQQSMGHPFLQSAMMLLYSPLRFGCKSLITAPVTTRYPEKWIQLNLVVDILFARVQVSTFPFVDGYYTLLLLFITEVSSLAWCYYFSVDRLILIWAFWTSDTRQEENHSTQLLCQPLWHCIWETLPCVSRMNLIPRCQASRLIRRRVCIPRSTSSFMDYIAAFEEQKSALVPDKGANKSSSSIPCIFSLVKIWELGLFQALLRRKSCSYSLKGPLHFFKSILELRRIARRHVVRGSPCYPLGEYETFNENGRERPLHDAVDSTGAHLISIIVRMNQLVSITVVRSLPSANHLNKSFQISDERWKESQVFGWTFVVMMVFIHVLIGKRFFRRLRKAKGTSIVLDQVMAYLCDDTCWFFFLWLVSTGSLVCASMVNHFGVDFTLQFKWVTCPDGVIEWPGCPSLMTSRVTSSL